MIICQSNVLSQLVQPEFIWGDDISRFSKCVPFIESLIDGYVPSKRIDFDAQIGVTFANLKLPKRKINSKKSSPDACVILKFLEYSTNQNEGYHGLILYHDIKVVSDFEHENRFALGEPILFYNNKKYNTSNPSDDVISVYTISTLENPLVIIDTCIMVNLDVNYSERNSSKNYKPFLYLKSDMREKEDNIAALRQWWGDQRHARQVGYIADGFDGSEKILYPKDSVYVYGINYKVNTLACRYESGQYRSNIKTRDIQITDEQDLYTSSIAFSNSSDLTYITDNVNSKLEADLYHKTCISKLDSVWFIKAIHISELYDENNFISTYITNNQLEINIDDLVSEAKPEYDTIEFWNSWVDESDSLGLVEYNVSLKLVPKMKTKQNPQVSTQTINTKIAEGLDFYIQDYTTKKDEPKSVTKTINFMRKGEDQTYLMNKRFDPRVNSSDFVIQYESYSLYPIGLDSTNIKRAIASQAFSQREIDEVRWAKEKKAKESENKAERQKHNNKYGKKYVDAAFEFNVIVGMHEDLLSYALSLWSLQSRDDFSNGYSLYLYSDLDTSVHLYVTVTNKKVSRVSVW
jgi:hypothetical protein